MRDSEYCAWKHGAVGSCEETMTLLWSFLLCRSFTSLICTALPGGTSVWTRRSEGRCTTDWCLLLRSCLTRLRNTLWISCCSRGHCSSAGTKSPSRRWTGVWHRYIHFHLHRGVHFNIPTGHLLISEEIFLQLDKHPCLTCWSNKHAEEVGRNRGCNLIVVYSGPKKSSQRSLVIR